MKVSPDDFDDVLRHLIHERNSGNEYVVFPGSDGITRNELACFATQYEAAEFCYENSTDLDDYYYMSVRSAYRTMSEAHLDKSLLVENNGLIDIAAMVMNRYERLSPDGVEDKPGVEFTVPHMRNLEAQLSELDYPRTLQSVFDYHTLMDIPEFSIGHINKQGNELTFYEMDFTTGVNGAHSLAGYTVRYRPPIEIPDNVINGVNLRQLDKDLGQINWAFDPFPSDNKPASMYSSEELALITKADSALRRLDTVSAAGEEGRELGNLLMYKHWTNGYYLRFVPDHEQHRERYEWTDSSRITHNEIPVFKDIRERLKGQAMHQKASERESFSNHLKSTIMNEKNFDYLSKQIMYTGFGEGHTNELMQKMKENKPEFTIFHQQDFGKDNTVATLQFRRPEEGDMYFFNRYSLLLKSDKHEDPIKQTFYINNDVKKKEQQDITLKEGYNLLSGRAVEKDLVNKAGEKYTAWVQLDFKVTDKHGNYEEKKFHQNYGYDLEQLLGKHPIKELNTIEDKKMLMESLQRGNRQAVTFQIDGKEQRVFIEAAPQFKSINMYDSSMKRVNAQTLRESNSEGQTQQQDKKQSVKVNNAAAGEEDDAPSQSEKKGRKKGQKIS